MKSLKHFLSNRNTEENQRQPGRERSPDSAAAQGSSSSASERSRAEVQPSHAVESSGPAHLARAAPEQPAAPTASVVNPERWGNLHYARALCGLQGSREARSSSKDLESLYDTSRCNNRLP